jgi:two-component system, cell cycle sensor histidine kinase and response regulator CckA
MATQRPKATILVVDDEVSLRQLLVRQLRSEGYNVLEAGYGLEALAVTRDSAEPIDLVLTDIVMPGMIGTELAQRLLLEHPDIHVVLMSAHVIDSLGTPDRSPGSVPVLQKPFDGGKMLAYVQLALNTPAATRLEPQPLAWTVTNEVAPCSNSTDISRHDIL